MIWIVLVAGALAFFLASCRSAAAEDRRMGIDELSHRRKRK